MPLYEITTTGEDAKRLVEADSSAQAIRHCATGKFTARTIQKPAEIAALMGAGIKLERVGEQAGEPAGDDA